MRWPSTDRAPLAAAVVVFLALLLPSPTLAQEGIDQGQRGVFDGDPETTERIDAPDPIAAAVAMSQVRFADGGARHVVLSRDDVFADSLAGAPLSDVGPLLLTPGATLSGVTWSEITRVLPAGGTVYLLGGELALSAELAEGIQAFGYTVTRLDGASRVETSVRVAEEVRTLHPESRWVALARDSDWADSVTGGAWAAAVPTAIMVTPTAQVHPAVADALRRFAPDRVVLFGGELALSAAVEEAVPNPLRLSGSERSGTAAAIASELWPESSRYIVIHGYRPDGWAYGLPAAGLAADQRAPLLIANEQVVPDPTLDLAGPCGNEPSADVLLVGSTSVLSDSIRGQLDTADGALCPPSALDATAQRIHAEVIVPAGIPGTVTCPVVASLVRGEVHTCVITPDDLGQAEIEPMTVIVRDAAGNTSYDYGRESPTTPQELADEGLVPGLLCRDVAGQGWPYFYAVMYWFFEGAPERMDADGDGIPCETVYQAEAVVAFWSGAPPGTFNEPPPPPLVLRGDGLQAVPFFTSGADTIAALEAVLGPLEEDSGVLPEDEVGFCGYPGVQFVEWGRLSVAIGFDGAAGSGEFFGYSYGVPFEGDDPGYPALSTAAGITVGSSVADVRSAYGPASVAHDELYGPLFYVELPEGYLSGAVTSTDDSGQLQYILHLPCGD